MNDNCLSGCQCRCGSLGPFKITVQATAVVTDDGTEQVTELEWNDQSRFTCPACGRHGVVGELRGVPAPGVAVSLTDLHVPDECWEDWSGEGEPAGVVLGTSITLNGTFMHVEAIEVEESALGEQVARDCLHEERLSRYHDAAGADGRMETVEIAGRHYCVFASPFC